MIIGSLLCKMQGEERDPGCEVDHDEKREAGHSGNLSHMWHEDVQDRESRLRIINHGIDGAPGFTRTDIPGNIPESNMEGLLAAGRFASTAVIYRHNRVLLWRDQIALRRRR